MNVAEALQDDLYQETSQQFIGQWNKLVSTTNWEKGRIIFEWRQELVARGASLVEYSDEAWSRRVGNVSPQHVGRLRRVAERFGDAREEFGGLYWSHFQATLDWEDAEMWLEGAVQNRWSVSQMKHQRWEALGAPDELKPRDEDVLTGELDEDIDPQVDGAVASTVEAGVGDVQDFSEAPAPWDDGEDAADEDEVQSSVASHHDEYGATAAAEEPKSRLFEHLPSLPEDLADAVEAFKLSIIRHKLLGWDEIARDDVVKTLEALTALALTPADQ